MDVSTNSLIKNKQPERDEIARQIKEYEAKGGVIKKAEVIETAYLNPANASQGII